MIAIAGFGRLDNFYLYFAEVGYLLNCSAEARDQLDQAHAIMTFQQQQYRELRQVNWLDTHVIEMEICSRPFSGHHDRIFAEC